MKKKVLVIVIHPETKQFYYKVMKNIFEDYIDLEIIAIKNGVIPDNLNVDIILYSMPFMEFLAREKSINPNTEYINMGLIIDGNSIEELRKIEKGTSVLLLSVYNVFLCEIRESLRRYGVDNINLISYYGQSIDIKSIKYAVYMGLQHYDFPHIENYINIGWRVMHPHVIRTIAQIAQINTEFISGKIDEYIKDEKNILGYKTCLNISINSEFIQERLAMLDMLEYPVIMLDSQSNIIAANERFREEFKIDYEAIIGSKVYTNKILSDIFVACDNDTKTGMYIGGSGKKYKLVKRLLDTMGMNVTMREVIEIQPLAVEVSESQTSYSFEDILYKSEKMAKVVEMAKKVAPLDATVLIAGESGTGKELLAHSIHAASKRFDKPFVAVNCGAFPENILESELFGYAPGSFTGALKTGKKGLLELAHGGTLFLDEIGDASLKTQVRLLRFLQEKEVQPVGSSVAKKVDVRIICATNIDLEKATKEGTMREDFYYRISPITIGIPPLRERGEDIELLIRNYLNSDVKISSELRIFLNSYEWPGNTRELRGCAEYLSYFGGEQLEVEHLPERYQQRHGYIKNSMLAIIDDEKILQKKVLEKLGAKSIGRRGLVKELRVSGYDVSEHEIKNILKYLHEQGLISIERGRNATKITEKGIDVLKELEN